MTVEKSATLRIVMEEWSLENLAMALMGSAPAANVDGGVQCPGGRRGARPDPVRGRQQRRPQVTITLPLVAFTPAGSINPISDEWGSLEVSGDVLISGGIFGTITHWEPA